MRLRRMELSIFVALVITIIAGNFISFGENCAAVRQDTLRLHILAVSDSEKDQADKLQVRDAVLTQYGTQLSQSGTKQEAIDFVTENAADIAATANAVLKSRGSSASAKVSVETLYFATKEYDGFTLPAGQYDAVRIEIGKAAGKNWFCVMYPALCLPAATEETTKEAGALQTNYEALDGYTKEEQDVLKSPYTVKFALVEWWESYRQKQQNANT